MLLLLKNCHSLHNNPSGHNQHLQRHSRKKKKKLVYVGISWNLEGPYGTHTLPQTNTQTMNMFKHGCRTLPSVWPQLTPLNLHFSSATEGFSNADYLVNKCEAHKLARFWKVHFEKKLHNLGCNDVPNNRVLVGTVSNTSPRKGNLHPQELNTRLQQAIRCFVI